MTWCFCSGVLLAFFALPIQAQGPFNLSSEIVRIADVDGGGVTAEEWSAFKAELRQLSGSNSGSEAELDRRLVLTRVVAAGWDTDGDGTITISDLDGLFSKLDQDGNAKITREEMRPGAVSMGRFFSVAVLFGALEHDEDPDISRAEWNSLKMAATDASGTITMVRAFEWVAAAQAEPPPEDKNAITTGVYLLSLDAALDADYDGVLTEADLDQLFAYLDRDQNGDISQLELDGPPRRAGERQPRVPEGAKNFTVPLMPWQRSLEDAVALSRRSGKPLLICVNIDGESASEILARYQYRDPEFIALVKGFVPVLFSPDKHNPREHDDRGRRIPDPKFGRLITSEHTENEAELYERFFGGTRVAPRHIGATADGKILFDVKLVNDLSIINHSLERHGVFGEEASGEFANAGEQQLLNSPDAAFRTRLEELFVTADLRTRVRIAGLSLSSARETQHPEVLRMAFLDESPEVRTQAVWTVIQHPNRMPTELLLPAFRAAEGDADQMRALVGAVRRVADEASDSGRQQRAAHLQRVFTALGGKSSHLDADRWKLALDFVPRSEEVEPTPDQIQSVSRRLTDLERRLKLQPLDRELNLLFAGTLMRLARIQIASGSNPTYLFEDVRTAAALATSTDNPSGRALGYLAWSNFMLSDGSAVNYAARALSHLRNYAGSPLAAQVLQIFAKGRLGALYSAMVDESEWPLSWVTDVRDVYEVLLAHPLVKESQVIAYIGFLESVEAFALQADVVRRGIALFPRSTELHTNLRNQTLRDWGADALEAAYDQLPVPPDQAADFDWFAGLATLIAAERHVENRRNDQALLSYEHSIERFRDSIAARPEFEGSANHYIAFALAGSARLYTDGENWGEALEAIREGLSTSPNTASMRDGLGNTPAATAGRLHRALVSQGRATEASLLREVMDTIGF